MRRRFLEAVCDWTSRVSERDRERTFLDIAGVMAGAGLVERALTCARSITAKRDQVAALADVAAQGLPERRQLIAEEAWALTEQDEPGTSHAFTLSGLLPILEGELRAHAVRAMDVTAFAQESASAAARMVPLLLPEREEDLLAVALERPELLTAFVHATAGAPMEDVRRYWRRSARSAGRARRPDALALFAAIVPWTRRLGNDTAVLGVTRSIGSVRRCWP
jgi:hypothetical protein